MDELTDGPEPRVSILIPNFDNGRSSSWRGDRDFLGDLLDSLARTLVDDPTPIEILIADDGSTDDSIATARRWAGQTWADVAAGIGRANANWRRQSLFCRLTEDTHCGILSVVANRLTAAARGDICCRLDGDVVIHTPRWVKRLVDIFASQPPDVGVVGGQQLGIKGRIHSAGCMILHPRGHHHLGQGAAAGAIPFTLEVDHVMGCFYAHKRRLWSALDGYDESLRRGQTVDFGLRARRAGWRTICVPDIVFTHAHEDRIPRPTDADTEAGIAASRERFRETWGFDRLAPDLDEVRTRYDGTPLVWNARIFGPRAPWPARWTKRPPLTQTAWGRYAGDEAFRIAIDQRCHLAVRAGEIEADRDVLVVPAAEGLLAHLLTRTGAEVVGLDEDPERIACAQDVSGRSDGAHATYRVLDDDAHWPVLNETCDVVVLFDVLDIHPNPLRLLRETHRVLRPGGRVVLLARTRSAQTVIDAGPEHPYRPHELTLQLEHSGLFHAEPVSGDDVPVGTTAVVGCRRALIDDQSEAVSSVVVTGGTP